MSHDAPAGKAPPDTLSVRSIDLAKRWLRHNVDRSEFFLIARDAADAKRLGELYPYCRIVLQQRL